MEKILFEWDEKKNTLNKRKHGVSFEEAQTVFMTKMQSGFSTLTIPEMKIGLSCWE